MKQLRALAVFSVTIWGISLAPTFAQKKTEAANKTAPQSSSAETKSTPEIVIPQLKSANEKGVKLIGGIVEEIRKNDSQLKKVIQDYRLQTQIKLKSMIVKATQISPENGQKMKEIDSSFSESINQMEERFTTTNKKLAENVEQMGDRMTSEIVRFQGDILKQVSTFEEQAVVQQMKQIGEQVQQQIKQINDNFELQTKQMSEQISNLEKQLNGAPQPDNAQSEKK